MWCRISYHGVTYIRFCETGIKTNSALYEPMLETVVEPLNERLFEGNEGQENSKLVIVERG